VKRARLKWLAAVALAALVAGVAVGSWFVVRERSDPKRWGVVTPGTVYRSGWPRPGQMERVFREHGIKTIVNLCSAAANSSSEAKEEAAAAAKVGATVHYLPMEGKGSCDDLGSYSEAVALLAGAAKSGQPALIHCTHGTNRTGGVVAVYQALVEGKSTVEIRQGMLQYGFNPKWNKTLLAFLDKNMGAFAAALKRQGVVKAVPVPLPVINLKE